MMSRLSFSRVSESPWVPFGLFFLTYGAFGWLVGEKVLGWQKWILVHPHLFPWEVSPAIAIQMSWGFGCFLVLLLMVILSAPSQIIQLLFSRWLQSETKAIASVLAWAFTAVLIICWLDQFAHLFVLLAAGMLCYLDLRLRGLPTWQIFTILTAIGLFSFAFGGYLFAHLHGAVVRNY